MSILSPAAVALRTRISSVDAQIAALQQERTTLVADLRAILLHDPLLALPLDIAHYILDWVRFGVSLDHRTYWALQLSSVCRAWRDLIFAWPKMWTDIHVDCRRLGVDDATQAMETWMTRVGGSAINLALVLGADYARALSVWDAACRYSAQWGSLTLNTLALDSCELLVPQTLPELVELEVVGDVTLECSQARVVARHFRRLILDTPFVVYTTTVLPLEQVEYLRLQVESYAALDQILYKTPHIEHLHLITLVSDDESSRVPPQICVLTRLTSLTFSAYGPGPPAGQPSSLPPPEFLSALRLPALTTLTFANAHSFPTTPTALTALLSTAGCAPIQSLTIADPHAAPASIATHLSLPSLRALTHLSLSLLSFPAPALTDFFAGITQGTLVPELEVLLLHNAARCIETQRVADIVERRWRWQGGLSRIRHFEIGFRGKDVLEELPGVVEWMVRAGLKVKIEKI